MSKFELQHGVSKVQRTKLQSSIDQTVSDDIKLYAEWSNNDLNYVVNEFLRLGPMQDKEFQKYKANLAATAARPASSAKPAPTTIKPVTESAPKPDASAVHV